MPFKSAAQMGELNFEIGEKLDFIFTRTFVDGPTTAFGETTPVAYSIYKITPGASELIKPPLDANNNVETWAFPNLENEDGASWPTEPQTLFSTQDPPSPPVDFDIYTPTPAVGTYYTFAAGGDFAPGDHGLIALHFAYNSNLDDPTVATMTFKISQVQNKVDYIKDVDIADVGSESATNKPNSLAGRLLTCERNQTEVLMPRLRRALGLLGEHQLVDGFLYDDDGNITECRLRLFESAHTMVNNANIWNDRVNESDADALDLVTGEEARYTITASNLLPRNLRTSYQQKLTKATTGAADPDGVVDGWEPNDETYGNMSSGNNSNNGSVL